MKHFLSKSIIAFLAICAVGAGIAHADLLVTASPNVCIVYSYTLHIGSRDSRTNGEVTNLQFFLQSRGYLKHAPTGRFDTATRAAVRAYQRAHGIGPSGTVNFRTRAALMKDCGVTPPVSTPIITSVVPTTGAIGSTVTVYGTNFTTDAIVHLGIGGFLPASVTSTSIQFVIPAAVGPYCKPGMMCAMFMTSILKGGTYPVTIETAAGMSNAMNLTITDSSNTQPITLSGVDAPASLPVNTTGTWTVHVLSNGNGTLHYSALWGDEVASNAIMAPTATSFQSSGSFTHRYTATGVYRQQFTVTDDYGHSVTASTTVTVTPIY